MECQGCKIDYSKKPKEPKIPNTIPVSDEMKNFVQGMSKKRKKENNGKRGHRR